MYSFSLAVVLLIYYLMYWLYNRIKKSNVPLFSPCYTMDHVMILADSTTLLDS